MSLTQTRNFETVVGSMRMIGGTFTGADTTGDLRTGLQKTAFIYLQPTSAVSPTEQCTINTALPAADPITIGFTTGGVTGYWLAIGW
jgi:hypothetical protein